MEEELGMNAFYLDDEFMDEDPNQLDPNEHVNLGLNDEDDDPNHKQHNEEGTDEDESQDGVDGDAEDEGTEPQGDATSSPPLYKSLASHLYGKGILASVDSSKLENVKTVEDLEELVIEQIKASELNDLTPLQREAVQALRSGISAETFQKQKQTEDELDDITDDVIESDSDLRRQIIYQDFINKGYTEDKATKFTNRSFETGEDIEDAKESITSLREGVKERFKEQREYEMNQKVQAEANRKKEREAIESTILKTEEPFAGVKLNEIARKKVLETMLVPVGKNPHTGEEENALMKDQRENKDFSQKLYTVYTLSKGFTDFSAFAKSENKKTINDLEKALKSNQHIIAGGNPSFIDDDNASDYEIGDNIVYR